MLRIRLRGKLYQFPQITREGQDDIYWLASVPIFDDAESLLSALLAVGADFAHDGLSIYAPDESIRRAEVWLLEQQGEEEER